MAHCKPCEVCPIVELCVQAIMDTPCPLDEYENSTTNINNTTKEKK